MSRTLSVKELKLIIAQRRLDSRAAPLREKSELAGLVAHSSYPPLSARHYALASKWKASFAYAWADTKRLLMTGQTRVLVTIRYCGPSNVGIVAIQTLGNVARPNHSL